jgi:hypothetical protein
MIYDLTELTIYQYLIKSYDNPHCFGVEEFEEDIKRIKYIKRLINRYVVYGETKERLLLNHIISFYNVFGLEAATRILFFKIDEEYYSILKTYLTFLNYMPEKVHLINGKNTLDSDISIDTEIVKKLRDL